MHNIEHYTYSEKVSKKEVQASLDDYVSRQTWAEGGHGLEPIRWIDVVLDDYDAAMDYIEKHDKGWYDQLAVKYLSYDGVFKSTAKHTKLKEQIAETRKKYFDLNQKIHFEGVKSQYIGCKNCGSKLNKDYLKTNFCPMCRQDLRPKTTLDNLDNLKKKIEKLEKDLSIETKKIQEKAKKSAKVQWLVKIEYHT